MKEQIIKNLKDDKGLSSDELIYLIDTMVWGEDEGEFGDNRYMLTHWLMQNQYKPKSTLWIIEELMDDDSELKERVFDM